MNSNIGRGNNIGGGGSVIPPQAWFYIIGIPLVLGGVYFLMVRPVMKKLNIIKTAEDEAGEQTWVIIRKQPFWTNNYYKGMGGDTITSEEAARYAKILYEAMKGGWTFGAGTDKDAIYGVFSSLGSKGNISKVAEAYQIKYYADLLNHLEDELDTEDLLEVATKISMYSS